MRLVEFCERKMRDFYDEPLRVVYRKDAVSRARNILVYKGQRNIIAPATGIATIIAFLFGVETCYYIFYEEEHKQDPDYDENADTEATVLILMAGASSFALLVGTVLNRYVIRMYYNESKKLFTITTYSLMKPWLTQNRVVRAGTGRLRAEKVTPDGEVRHHLLYNCTIDGRKYLLYPEAFKYPVYFNVLFGHDDPHAIARLNDSDENADKIFRDRSKLDD